MTLLMFLQDSEGFVIATDTLATDRQGVPFFFEDKVRYYPHLRMAVAGTGWGDFAMEWQRILCDRGVDRNVEDVDTWAPGHLALLWQEMSRAALPDAPPTTTVYHFGFDQGHRPIRFIYRSVNRFLSESSTESGFAVKPYLPETKDSIFAPSDPDDWVALALRIREEQGARPKADRIYIGGELVLTTLQPIGAQLLLLHRFEDYEEDWKKMVKAAPTRA
jgi:hypothetical protein